MGSLSKVEITTIVTVVLVVVVFIASMSHTEPEAERQLNMSTNPAPPVDSTPFEGIQDDFIVNNQPEVITEDTNAAAERSDNDVQGMEGEFPDEDLASTLLGGALTPLDDGSSRQNLEKPLPGENVPPEKGYEPNWDVVSNGQAPLIVEGADLPTGVLDGSLVTLETKDGSENLSAPSPEENVPPTEPY